MSAADPIILLRSSLNKSSLSVSEIYIFSLISGNVCCIIGYNWSSL